MNVKSDSNHQSTSKRRCLKNPNVSTVITGASRPEQVAENMKAAEVAPMLTSEVMERVEQVLQNKPQPDED